MENLNVPKLMTIREVAATGVISEHCLRNMVKEGQIPVIYAGRKALVNFKTFCDYINAMTVVN